MEGSKKEKAIAQAKANLAVDRIYLSQSFINGYLKKNNINVPSGPKLVLRMSFSSSKKVK